MTGLVRKATLFSACGLLLAGAAMAAVPSPTHSTYPFNITVVGTEAGTPDPYGTFTVIVRDLANNPVANSSVVVDASGASDIFLCTDAVAGQTVDCVTKTVRGVTDVTGTVTLTVVGAANNTAATATVASPGSGLDAVRLFADGVLLVVFHVTAVLDQNGASVGNGHNAGDLASLGDDLGSAVLNTTYRARSDYNYDEANDGLDLSFFQDPLGQSQLNAGSGSGCSVGPYCP
jgi:hypothetical protein